MKKANKSKEKYMMCGIKPNKSRNKGFRLIKCLTLSKNRKEINCLILYVKTKLIL